MLGRPLVSSIVGRWAMTKNRRLLRQMTCDQVDDEMGALYPRWAVDNDLTEGEWLWLCQLVLEAARRFKSKRTCRRGCRSHITGQEAVNA